VEGVRIALLTLYYPPEMFGNAPLVRTVVREFTRRGAQVDVVTMEPHHRVDPTQQPFVPDGATLHYVGSPRTARGVAGQLMNWWSFARGAAKWLSEQKPLVVLSVTPPFFFPAVLRKAISRRGHHHIHWLQDMYPAAIEVGATPSPTTKAVVASIVKKALAVPEAIVAVTEDWLGELTNGLGVPAERLYVCENWCGVELDGASPQLSLHPRRLLFAGNVGRIADMQTVLKALTTLSAMEWTLDICGSGAAIGELIELGRPLGSRVRFHGEVSESALSEFYSNASLGLVPLRKGASRASVPSKTYSYFAAALPVLAAVDEGSHFDRLVRREGVGWCARAGDVDDVARALREVLTAPEEELVQRGSRGRILYENHYSPEAGATRFADLVERLV
jgi:colanic acid biosynthesis glycosyl transferase WcaI